jgi:hypothetical protein
MATTIEAPSRWARELGIDHNEMRILSQLALGRLAERGETGLIVRVGRTYVYGEPLKDAIREMVPVFKKGKSIYLEK